MTLECRNISLLRKSGGKTEKIVLDDITVRFAAGRLTWISGPTGVGKTTFLNVLGCLLRPTQGEVIADGEAVSRPVSWQRDCWRRHVGIVFQQHRLIPDLSVLENVMLPLIPRNMGLRKTERSARSVLDDLALTHLAGERVNLLSGGEQQRVSIARALVCGPRYVLADEPFAHQDVLNTRRIIEKFKAAAANGCVIVIAVHGLQTELLSPTDECYLLDNGRLTVMK